MENSIQKFWIHINLSSAITMSLEDSFVYGYRIISFYLCKYIDILVYFIEFFFYMRLEFLAFIIILLLRFRFFF